MSHSIFHTRINEAQNNVIVLFALISCNLTSRQRLKSSILLMYRLWYWAYILLFT